MSANGKHSAQVYTCPECAGKLIVSNYSSVCSHCGHYPEYTEE